MIAAFKNRIPLSPGYHAEPGETRGHQHDVYTTKDVGENRRIHVGTLTKDAVEAWATRSPAEAGAEPTLDEVASVKASLADLLREWNDTTGIIAPGSSYFYEMHSLMEDGFDAAAALFRPYLDRLRGERDVLADQVHELQQQPWPAWAEEMKSAIRRVSGYDGYDDRDGVDLPAELDELISELTTQAEARTQEARAKYETDQHKSAAEHYRKVHPEICDRATEAEAALLASEAERADLARELTEAREALEPFAKAGELFERTAPEALDALIYAPAAGPEYNLASAHLRRARARLHHDQPEAGRAALANGDEHG